jgi:predicted transcriptional regulator YheO
MNESEVEDALRNIVEMVTTSVVTGEKRSLSRMHDIVNQNKSLHEDIKTQIINILPQKVAHKAHKLWTKKDHDVVQQLIREKVIKKWPDWAGMSKHLDRSRKSIGNYMRQNEEFSGKMKTLLKR